MVPRDSTWDGRRIVGPEDYFVARYAQERPELSRSGLLEDEQQNLTGYDWLGPDELATSTDDSNRLRSLRPSPDCHRTDPGIRTPSPAVRLRNHSGERSEPLGGRVSLRTRPPRRERRCGRRRRAIRRVCCRRVGAPAPHRTVAASRTEPGPRYLEGDQHSVRPAVHVQVDCVVGPGHLLLSENPRQGLPFRVNPGRQLERERCRRRVPTRLQLCPHPCPGARIAPQHRGGQIDQVRPGAGCDAPDPRHVPVAAAQALSRVRQRNDPVKSGRCKPHLLPTQVWPEKDPGPDRLVAQLESPI